MAYARFVTWKFKPGMREKALERIDGFSEEAKKTKGFLDILAFRSAEDPNTAYILSLWDSEESLDAACNGIIRLVMGSVSDMAAEPPSVKKLEAREMVAGRVLVHV